jgi:hypothetical protein
MLRWKFCIEIPDIAKIAQNAKLAKLAKALLPFSGYKLVMIKMIDNPDPTKMWTGRATESRRHGEKMIYPQITQIGEESWPLARGEG